MTAKKTSTKKTSTKKTSTKKTSTKKGTTPPKSTVRSAKSVRRAKTPLRKSKYDWYIDKLNNLKKGQALLVPLPAGISARRMQTRLAAIEYRRIEQGILKLPKGWGLTHYQTDDGQVAVELVEYE